MGVYMAGYLASFSTTESLQSCIRQGLYSPLSSEKWSSATDPTLSDFATMAPGDNLYFFSNRSVYGIGEIIDIVEAGGTQSSADFENFPGATTGAKAPVNALRDSIAGYGPDNLIREGKAPVDKNGKPLNHYQRWVVLFKPSPSLYSTGVDMDDLLRSDPAAFRSTRTFEKRSFIKLDDEENLAMKSSIVRLQLLQLRLGKTQDILSCEYSSTVSAISKSGVRLTPPDIPGLIAHSRKGDGGLKSEARLELGTLCQLAHHDGPTEDSLGKWDYLSHQVPASPMKSIQYMDRIDIFGYSWVQGYEGKIIDKYLVIELKKDTAGKEAITQTMKYVDWVCQEYAHGDYTRITAFTIASDFFGFSETEFASVSRRAQVVGRSGGSATIECNNLSLLKYTTDSSGHITYTPCEFPLMPSGVAV